MTDRNGAGADSPYAPGSGWAPPPRSDPRPGPPGTNGANNAPAPAPRPPAAPAPAGAGGVPWWGFADEAGRGLSSTGGAPPPGWGDPPPPAPASFGPPPGPAPQWGPPPAPQWGPPPGPGWGPPPAGYGYPGYAPGQTHIRHRPGVGLVLGLVGLALLILSHTALPWYSVDLADGSSESVTLGEIGDMLSDLHDSVVSGGLSVPEPDATATVPATIPPVTDSGGGPIGVPVMPTPVSPTPVSPIGGSASVDEDLSFLRYYANGSWIMLVIFGILAVVFSCWWVPRSRGGRGVTGFVMLGVFGLTVNLVDEKGAVGSRICAVAGVLIGTLLFGAAVVKVFNHDGSPGYGPAIYVGACGLLLMLVGCAVGTRRESVPGPA